MISEEPHSEDILISDFQPPDDEKINFHRSNQPVHGILLQQPFDHIPLSSLTRQPPPHYTHSYLYSSFLSFPLSPLSPISLRSPSVQTWEVSFLIKRKGLAGCGSAGWPNPALLREQYYLERREKVCPLWKKLKRALATAPAPYYIIHSVFLYFTQNALLFPLLDPPYLASLLAPSGRLCPHHTCQIPLVHSNHSAQLWNMRLGSMEVPREKGSFLFISVSIAILTTVLYQ